MIHGEHPFQLPENERDPVRRFRGRLTSPVTLWTASAGGAGGRAGSDVRRAGLPVSAVMVAEGEPGRLLGLVDADSELWDVLESTGRFAVSVLRWEHRALSEAFAGLAPAPGGAFRLTEWRDTEWGPVPATVSTWAGCRLVEARSAGWPLLVEAELEHIDVGTETDSLLHRRGRYLSGEALT